MDIFPTFGLNVYGKCAYMFHAHLAQNDKKGSQLPGSRKHLETSVSVFAWMTRLKWDGVINIPSLKLTANAPENRPPQ